MFCIALIAIILFLGRFTTQIHKVERDHQAYIELSQVCSSTSLTTWREEPSQTDWYQWFGYEHPVAGLEFASLDGDELQGVLRILPVFSQLILLDIDASYNDGEPLTRTPFRDKDIEALQSLTQLRYLSFRSTEITDNAIPKLSVFHKLENLDISSTKITSNAIKSFPQLSHLKVLNCAGTDIDDLAVPYFQLLPRLKTLDLTQTRMTPKGVKELRAKLEHCEIIY